MRVTNPHSWSSATESRGTTAPRNTGNGFADVLDSASSSDRTGTKPELSAATYRLFAAVALERGDSAHADHFRSRAAAAREAGLPLQPSGVLSENGRWDYTDAAAQIPETGRFDNATGQGVRSFAPYNTTKWGGGTSVERIAQAANAKATSDSDPMRFITRRKYSV